MKKGHENLTNEQKLALVAYWLCKEKPGGEYYRQVDLPDVLGTPLKRWERSRLAQEGLERGFYSVNTIHTLTLPPELLDFVQSRMGEYRELETRLLKRFKALNRVLVGTGSVDDPGLDDDRWDKSLTAFSKNLVTEFLNRLDQELDSKGSLAVGIGWGRTLASFVEAICEKKPWYRWKERLRNEVKLRFFPLWGSLYQTSVSSITLDNLAVNRFDTSSTGLAEALNAAFAGRKQASPSLLGLSAILPAHWAQGGDFEARKRRYLEDLSSFTAYDQIYRRSLRGDETRPLIEEMDVCLVTVGSQSHPSRFLSGKSIKSLLSPQLEEKFSKFCVGYIGGVLLPKARDDESRNAICELSEYFTCTKYEHLQSLAVRSQIKRDNLGVCAVVHGAKRLDAVVSALDEGLINTLCICQHLAKALESWLQVKEKIETSQLKK